LCSGPPSCVAILDQQKQLRGAGPVEGIGQSAYRLTRVVELRLLGRLGLARWPGHRGRHLPVRVKLVTSVVTSPRHPDASTRRIP
jgi:hypothetical protein